MCRWADRLGRGAAAAWGLAVALVAGTASAQTAAGDTPRFGFGRAATAAEIAGWDIDVRPDGHGVRKGRGTVAQGQDIYDAQCASCHGTFGESNRYMAIAGGVKKGDLEKGRAAALTTPDGIRTVGTKLNYATTLWDYIYRAMPWTNPQSLTVDQTYAVTAYVLHLNEIVPADFELNDGNLARLPMPNRLGMTTRHGMWSVAGKPDVQGSTCMKDCVKAVTVTSSLPEYARNQHGNLAEQKRTFGPVRGIDTTRYDAGKATVASAAAAPAAAAASAVATAKPQDLLARNACTACHAVDSKVVGPSFREIAAKYGSRADAEAYLAKKIKEGGQGAWGAIPMPPQPALKDDDARTLARWIVAGAK
jgi:S-disulfanyl-L-cysteine oxidoreductase SoxD